MVVFKFEEDKKKHMLEYLMELSIWRYAKIGLNQEIQLDQFGYEQIFSRKFKIRNLSRNISQFLPVFFSPHRTALLHLRFHSFVIQYKFLEFMEDEKKQSF